MRRTQSARALSIRPAAAGRHDLSLLALLALGALVLLATATSVRAQPAGEAPPRVEPSRDATPVATPRPADVAPMERRTPAVSAPAVKTAPAALAPLPARPVKPRWWKLEATFEMGFVGVLHHKIQFSRVGDYFDYVKEGGQELLYPYMRLGAGIRLFDRHNILFVYQPLQLKTASTLKRDVTQGDTTFAAGTPMEFLYGFDFYRISYTYDIFKAPRHELSFGLSLQIRDANIEFTSTDGTQRYTTKNLGPVPVIKIRGRYQFRNGLFLGGEVDGFWASSKFANGSSRDFEGAIIDTSLKLGLKVYREAEVFLNLRYIAGGALGSSSSVPGPDDGYTRNWIHLMSLSLGLGYY
jgi:hypothetical protein